MCGKPGYRTDVCPAPVPEAERCSLCSKTGLDASHPHECDPGCVLCGGSHATASRDCPHRYRQPAATKRLLEQAGRARDCSRKPSGDHKKQQESSNVAGNHTSVRQSRPRSKKWATSRSKSGSWSRRPQSAQKHTEHEKTSREPSPALKSTRPQVSWAPKVTYKGTKNSSKTTESPIIEQLISTIEKQNRTLAQLQQLVAQQKQEIEYLRQATTQRNQCPQISSANSADGERPMAPSTT
ncbi:hypothetical protein MRX96_014631 [Rhipicephalus microplus]